MYLSLQTSRLIIRPIATEDDVFILQLLNSEGWLKYIGDRKVNSRNDALDYIRKILNNPSSFYHILVERESESPVGLISLLKREDQPLPDFGFALLTEHQGKGFAFEASRHYLDTFFKQSNQLELMAITLSDNESSIQLLNRLGFKFTGNNASKDENLSLFKLSSIDMATSGKEKIHVYHATIKWTGNNGTGTSGYTAYERDHRISIEHKSEISGSSDPAFRGDRHKHNPEDLFVSSISACHMLWFLHLSAIAGVIVTTYQDEAKGTMEETANGGGRFTEVVLNPVATVADLSMVEMAYKLHEKANELCFIANSLNFPVKCHPVTLL
jgi:organic hydroperoxide reductase OsmC/OhrA/RimJ/RimL family protein N-acetyltransferase